MGIEREAQRNRGKEKGKEIKSVLSSGLLPKCSQSIRVPGSVYCSPMCLNRVEVFGTLPTAFTMAFKKLGQKQGMQDLKRSSALLLPCHP